MNMKGKTEKFLAENIEEYIHDLKIDKDFLNKICVCAHGHTHKKLYLYQKMQLWQQKCKVEDVIDKEFDSK